MRRIVWSDALLLGLLGPACAVVLLLACFAPVLFQGEQFAHRHAATFYYPLYRFIQQEWNVGRWPLWDPGQNAGVPLLGMPMAAVLYPGKVLYALLPYPWAVRFYTVLHVAIAWAGTFAVARTSRLSATAAGLSALGYAFGAPVLFLYGNIPYLVGAAWIPWGFLAAEWLIGQKRRWGVPVLSAVLALQVLGGDPEAACVTVLCGVVYALVGARRGPHLAALACASVLALALAGAQLVPAWEYAAEAFGPPAGLPGRFDEYRIELYRLLEAVWPDVWGRFGPENGSWIQALPPVGERLLGTPSLYFGGLIPMLAAAGLGFSRRMADGRAPAWRMWLAIVAIGAVAAALGGFAKLLPFAALALTILAGLGWDRMAVGRTRTPQRYCLTGLAVTLAALLLIATAHCPVEPRAALAATVRGLVHGGLVLALGLVLCRLAPRRPRCAGALALIGMTLDLGLASAPLISTVPQADFETTPRALALIKEAQAEEDFSAPGPFRVHRMAMAVPGGQLRGTARERLRAALAWQRDTLEPLFGQPLGLKYTLCQGFCDRDDYLLFFGKRPATAAGSGRARSGPYVHTVPRLGPSLWNARYVILPVSSNGWIGVNGGLERIFPPSDVVADAEQSRRWIDEQDWQLAYNRDAFPRAWLVHYIVVRAPVAGPNDPGRLETMQELVYQAEPMWSEPGRPLADPRAIAFVETDQPRALAGYVSRTVASPGESVTITRDEPQRVELVVELKRPGLVILADTFDPGWSLTIDGAPAPIFRTNRLMRGAAVKAGKHTLVYTYNPASFGIGAGLSLAGLMALIALVPWAWVGSRSRLTRQSAPGEVK
jgi:hypothetical protein